MKALLLFCLFWASGLRGVCAQDAVTVPFQLTGNHLFVSIHINGKGPFPAAFDTGGLYLMSPALAKELHLTPHGTLTARGFGEDSVKIGLTEVESVQIGGLTLPRSAFAVMDAGDLSIQSMIGYEVLRRFVVKIDYDAHLLTLTRPDQFVYRGSGIVLPLHLHGHIPAVEGAVDGITGLFTLDTGSGGALDLFAPFVRAHDLRRKYAAGFTAATGIGIGGVMQGQAVHVGNLTLGAATLRNVRATLSAAQGGAASDPEVAGNIGEGVLKQFNLTFDYTHGQVILEKNKGYGRPEDGHAGIALEPQGRAWRVTDVASNGAAAQAGIEEGSRVLTIEGKDARQLPPFALWDVFHQPVGTKVWMLFQDGEQKRLVALTLR